MTIQEIINITSKIGISLENIHVSDDVLSDIINLVLDKLNRIFDIDDSDIVSFDISHYHLKVDIFFNKEFCNIELYWKLLNTILCDSIYADTTEPYKINRINEYK